MATRQPCCTSFNAIALPTPLPLPVTTALLIIRSTLASRRIGSPRHERGSAGGRTIACRRGTAAGGAAIGGLIGGKRAAAIGAVSGLGASALYAYKLAGPWRWIYVGAAVFALFLNVFVGVVQTFQKVAFFHALAPTQTEPPFAVVQGAVLLAFIVLGMAAVKKFHPPVRAADLARAV